MKTILFLVITFLMTVTLSAQSLINSPECVRYDSVNCRYLVSCLMTGNVVQIDTLGNEQYFRTGLGNAYGNHIAGDTFYVSTGHEIYSINLIDSSEIYWGVMISSTFQVDGMVSDTSGNLYIGGYDFPDNNDDVIYKVDIATQAFSVFVDESDGLAPSPQGIHFDRENNRLIVVGYSTNAPIQAISLPDGTISTIANTTIGGFDGIAHDNYGNYYLSAYGEGNVYKFNGDFINPAELISEGHIGPSNLGYNRIDDILAISNYGGDKVDFLNMKVDFESDTSWGQVPLEVNFNGFSRVGLDVDNWNWDFGDSELDAGQSVLHTFSDPGMYNINLSIDVGDTSYSIEKSESIIVLADTLVAGNVQGEVGTTVEVLIYARNTVPVNYFRIPVEYPGLLNISLDSFSTDGCRTDYFDNLVQNDYDPMQWRSCFTLNNNSSGSTPDLEPGAGSSLKLYFSIPSSAVFGRTSSLIMDGYSTKLPEIKGGAFKYSPNLVDGLVSLPCICGDATGDFNSLPL